MNAFPERPVDWDNAEQEKEVFARFGLASYHAQCFEHSVVNLLLTAELVAASKVVDSKEAWEQLVDHILDSSFELTLGNILRRLEQRIAIEPRTMKIIRDAKDRRDWLAHRFFREHAEDFVTSSGRLRMLDVVEEHGTHIYEAMQIVDLIEGATAKHLGDTPERREEFYSRYFKEVLARE
ncbi:hypothetical protein ACFQRC_02070 [Enterovirga sp. GCM10030262]|uniref:hypothetical protein n=1 Tax=Enterovirga sp. GCM10030262 TaxID=3273391 RepID=UPI0036112CD5